MIALAVLPWLLWAHVETAAVPAVIPPSRASDVLARYETYAACERVAQWAESQTDLREEWTVTKAGKFHTTMTYTCTWGGK